jgi:hypothetical protein
LRESALLVGCAAAAIVLYAVSASPGLAHADQAIVLDAMCSGTLASGATHHNLTALAGYLPCHLGSPDGIARRGNLVSAVLGGLAVGVFLAAVRRVASWPAALLGALFLALSHSMWWHATVAEVYAMNALACAVVLYALVRADDSGPERWLPVAAIAAGLGAFNHLQMGMWVPALGLAALLGPGDARARTRLVLRTAGAYLAGLLPLLLVFLKDLRATGAGHASREMAGGEFTALFFTLDGLELMKTGRLFLLQWGWPSLFLVWTLWGVVVLARGREWRRSAVGAGAAFLVNTTFFASYPTWDRYAFLLPSFVTATFFGALGLNAAWARLEGRPVPRLALLAANVAALAWMPVFFASLPLRARTDPAWSSYATVEGARLTMLDGPYQANPDKSGHDLVERYVQALATALPENALLVDHVSATFFQLRHAQRYRGWRRDLTLRLFVPAVTDPARWPSAVGPQDGASFLRAALARGPVFVTSLHLGGFSSVVGELLDADLTWIEHRFAPGLSAWELVPATRISGLPLVRSVERTVDPQSGASSLLVRFVDRNPPLKLGVAGTGESYRIPFDSPPVQVGLAPGAPSGLTLFGRALSSAN